MKKYIQIGVVCIFAFIAIPACSAEKKLSSASPKNHQNDSIVQASKRQSAALFSDGLKERLAGNDELAISKFEQALKADSEDHASMYELSDLYARLGRIDESLTLMKKAVALQPENQWYQIRLGQIYKYKGDYDSYADVYRFLLKLDPGNIDYFSELSTALVLLEKYDDALKVFNEMEKQTGINETLSVQKQSIYFDKKEIKKGISEIEKLSEAYPYELRYIAMLAEMYMQYGPKEKALDCYNRIVKIDPSDPYVHISMAEYYRDQAQEENAFNELLIAFQSQALDVETKVQIMVLWFEKSTLDTTVNQQLVQIAEVFQKVHPTSPRGFQLMAEANMRDSDFENARKNFLLAVDRDKSSYLVWENLLFADIQLSDFNALGDHARQTQVVFPEQPLPYLFEGISLVQNEESQAALKVFEMGRKFVVGNDALLAEFYSNIADAQHKLGNHVASDEAFDKSLALKPDNNIVLNNYAYYLSLRGEKLDKALQMSIKANELSKDNPTYLDTQAWVLYKMGDYANALIYMEKTIRLSEEINGTLWEHYGDILFKLGRKEEAIEQWKKALQAGETSKFIEKKIKDGKLYE